MIVPLHAHSYTLFFFFNDTATTEIYTLSLHDALPIYSAELYRYLDGKDQGAGKRRALFVSWAKYSDKWVNDLAEEQFNRVAQVTYEIRKAEAIPYLETTRTMNKYGKIRAVVIESGRDKKRAAIYTNGTAEELGAERIVQLICRRWGEENAIKELLHKHLINYTPGYVREELEEQPLVENPELRERKKQRAGLVSELNRLKIELADHLLEPPAKKRGTPSRSQKEVMDDIAVIEGRFCWRMINWKNCRRKSALTRHTPEKNC